MSSHVYFLATRSASEAFVKIGYTEGCPWVRMAAVALWCPFPLEIVGLEPGGHREEQAYHKLYRSLRVRGEWFRLQGGLIDHVVRLPTPDRKAFHQNRTYLTRSGTCRDCREQYDKNDFDIVHYYQLNGAI